MFKLKAAFFSLITLSFVVLPHAASGAPKEVTLKITEAESHYELSVPVSRLVMTIPKNGLSQKRISGGATDSLRYFFFEDKTRGLVASGWFESSSAYSNFNKYWNGEKKSWQSGSLPAPINEKFLKSVGWEAVAYDISFPKGENSHIRAHWVQAGTWIDLHLSLTSETKNSGSREKLLEILKGIQIKQRH